jgi:hypothetical protein
MKAHPSKNNNNMQGSSTADRAFTNKDRLKENGISNAGGQPSFTTSSKDSMHKPEKKKG